MFDKENTLLSNLFSFLVILFSWCPISYIVGKYSESKDFNNFLKQKNIFNFKKELIKLIGISLFCLIIYINFDFIFNLNNIFYKQKSILFFNSNILFSIYLQWIFSKKNLGLKKIKKVIIYGNKLQFDQISNWLEKKKFKTSYTFIKGKRNIIRERVSDIILFDQDFNTKTLTYLLRQGYTYKTPSQWFSEEFQKIPSEFISDNEILTGSWDLDKKGFSRRFKRLGDIILSLIILVCSLPIVFIVSIFIYLEDKGPIFYSQERTGHRGMSFKIYKLRTMYVGAEKGKAQWAKKNDKRITKVGNILRKTRIDELPQLVSVLFGDMSLIGPRPERRELEKLIIQKTPNYLVRYSVLPGLSGWAQVNYPYGASLEDTEEKLSYDLYYLKNYSLWLDLLILIKTIRLLLNLSGSTPIN